MFNDSFTFNQFKIIHNHSNSVFLKAFCTITSGEKKKTRHTNCAITKFFFLKMKMGTVNYRKRKMEK